MELSEKEIKLGYTDLNNLDKDACNQIYQALKITNGIEYVRIGYKYEKEKNPTTREWKDMGIFIHNTVTGLKLGVVVLIYGSNYWPAIEKLKLAIEKHLNKN